jgi:hypothetical protein
MNCYILRRMKRYYAGLGRTTATRIRDAEFMSYEEAMSRLEILNDANTFGTSWKWKIEAIVITVVK